MNKNNHQYFFQKKKTNLVKKMFEKGLSLTTSVLIGINEFSTGFADHLPNDPRLGLLKFVLSNTDFGIRSKDGKKKKPTKREIQTAISRLKKRGLIRISEKEKIILTNEGKELVAYIKNRYNILSKEWDGKLRIVIFDIPEDEKRFRGWFRQELSLLLFRPLQKSVYIGKYPLPDDLYQDLIKNDFLKYIYTFTINKSNRQKEILELLGDK